MHFFLINIKLVGQIESVQSCIYTCIWHLDERGDCQTQSNWGKNFDLTYEENITSTTYSSTNDFKNRLCHFLHCFALDIFKKSVQRV